MGQSSLAEAQRRLAHIQEERQAMAEESRRRAGERAAILRAAGDDPAARDLHAELERSDRETEAGVRKALQDEEAAVRADIERLRAPR